MSRVVFSENPDAAKLTVREQGDESLVEFPGIDGGDLSDDLPRKCGEGWEPIPGMLHEWTMSRVLPRVR
jgi:hypothetical protein